MARRVKQKPVYPKVRDYNNKEQKTPKESRKPKVRKVKHKSLELDIMIVVEAFSTISTPTKLSNNIWYTVWALQYVQRSLKNIIYSAKLS